MDFNHQQMRMEREVTTLKERLEQEMKEKETLQNTLTEVLKKTEERYRQCI